MGVAVARARAGAEGQRQAKGARLLRGILGNAVSMLASDLVNRATTFALYALVARHLGAYAFGQMSLALTLFYTFQILAVAGLKTLVTREVAKHRELTDRYLVNGSYVVVLASLASIISVVIFVWAMGYSADTSAIVLLLSIGLIPYALSAICEAVFQAWERMRLIAYANVPINAIKVGLAFALLTMGADLLSVVLVLLVSQLGIVIVEWALMLRHITVPTLDVRPEFALRLGRKTLTFLGIDGIIAVTGALNIVLLSKLWSETEVGLYNAGSQLLVPVTLVFQSVVLSVFPIMCRRYDANTSSLREIGERVIELMLAVAIPTAIGLFFLANSAVRLLYGSEGLEGASAAVRIMAWGLILTSLTSILGQILIASLRETTTLRIVAIDLAVSLVAGAFLISNYGVVGASLTAVITRAVDLVLHYLPVSRMFSAAVIVRVVWKPALSSFGMAAYFVFSGSASLIAMAASAACIYLASLFVLTLVSAGGPRKLKRRYANFWAE